MLFSPISRLLSRLRQLQAGTLHQAGTASFVIWALPFAPSPCKGEGGGGVPQPVPPLVRLRDASAFPSFCSPLLCLCVDWRDPRVTDATLAAPPMQDAARSPTSPRTCPARCHDRLR